MTYVLYVTGTREWGGLSGEHGIAIPCSPLSVVQRGVFVSCCLLGVCACVSGEWELAEV